MRRPESEIRRAPASFRARWHCGRAALVGLVLVAVLASPAAGTPINPSFGEINLGSTDFEKLSPGNGYTLQVSRAQAPSMVLQVGQVLSLSFSVTFTDPRPSSSPLPYLGAVLVISSLRESGTMTCSAGGFPDLLAMDIERGSFEVGGSTGVVWDAVDPTGSGTICDSEDAQAPFTALVFEGAPGTYEFDLDLVANTQVDLRDGVNLVNSAYAIVPEPGTFSLCTAGLLCLAWAGRRRLRPDPRFEP